MSHQPGNWIAVLLAFCALHAPCGASFGLVALGAESRPPLLAGASAVDVTPRALPVIRNGGFLEAVDDRIDDPLFARCVVLDDGATKIALVVVDSCMIPRELCDEAKSAAAERTGIRADRIMISATHTHSAPSVMDYCLGSRADPAYTRFLPGRLVEAIAQANDRLAPAEVGWAVVDAHGYTNCRRWIYRPDKVQLDPFGERTVRANMHPGHLIDDATGPAGPTDPWLTVLSLRSQEGRPLAVFANFSMHYFGGHPGISADYCGLFARRVHEELAPDSSSFVGILSQGTSGDLWWGDYSLPQRQGYDIHQYTEGLVDLAVDAYAGITHRSDVALAMAERRMTLARRTPDAARLRWARQIIAAMGPRRPENQTEVYAMQAEYLHENPTEEVVLQAIRIGDAAITTFPNEVYGLTGLKIKHQSPLAPTMNVSLANGASGYIPPPEQHRLGGYNTWPARTAGLEVEAEPKMVAALLELLEEVSGKPRRDFREAAGDYANVVLADQPLAYYRLAELGGDLAADAGGHGRHAKYVGNFAYHLEGPPSRGFTGGTTNRCVHCVGGRLEAPIELGGAYSLELWFWNGLVNTARQTTGVLFSVGDDALVLTGTADDRPGRLALGGARGQTQIDRYAWNHVVLVRGGDRVTVYLNGRETPELDSTVATARETSPLVFGATADNRANFEGRFDEIAVYPGVLAARDAARHYAAATAAE
jgi:hypothetical protein